MIPRRCKACEVTWRGSNDDTCWCCGRRGETTFRPPQECDVEEWMRMLVGGGWQ